MVDTEQRGRVKFTDIESILELHHLRLEEPNDFCPGLFSIKELDVASCSSSNIDHPFKRRVFECLNGLQVLSVSTIIQEVMRNLPDPFQLTIGSPPR